MTTRKLTVDAEVAALADVARMLARSKGISAVEAFRNLIRETPRVAGAYRSRSMDPTDFGPFSAGSESEHLRGRHRTLRLDLEAALLCLDACCPHALGREGSWPTRDELEVLRTLVEVAVSSMSKKRPLTCWKRFQRVDGHFPKLRLCKRMTNFVKRIADSLPPRPLATLMPSAGTKISALLEEFFSLVSECRKGIRDPATVEWVEFVSLLLRYQNDERKRAGEATWTVLRQRPGAPTGGPTIEAYVAFLELDRADVLWMSRNWKNLWPVLVWVNSLGNAALVGKLASFWPGAVNMEESINNSFEEMEAEFKREAAKNRKAKSREKLGKKV